MNVKIAVFLGLLLGLIGLDMYAQQASGYYFYARQNGTTAELLDTNDKVVKTWTFNSGDRTGYSTYLLPGGTVLRTVVNSGNSFQGGPICGKVQKVSWDGTLLWNYTYSTANYCSHHDIHPMPNGNVLLIAYERRSASEASAMGSTQSIEMWPDKIVEVKPTGATTGEVVWEWKAWDHLVQSVNPNKPNYASNVADRPELLNINYKTSKDWMHANGLDYNPVLDQITFSSHALNEIYVIDHSTTTAEAAGHTGGNSGKGGDILYRWGNPAAYNTSGTAVINVTHDAHWVEPGHPNAGQLACFNNGGTSSNSTVDFVKAPVSGFTYLKSAGRAFEPVSYSSRIVGNGKTTNMGNSVQLANGNSLICIALAARFYEVTPAGTTVFTKTISSGGGGGGPSGLPQAQHYTDCEVYNDMAVQAKSRKRKVCVGESVQLMAESFGTGQYSYTWSPSEGLSNVNVANPILTATKSTTYYVTISNGGCSATSGVYVEVYDKPSTSGIAGASTSAPESTQSYSVTGGEGSVFEWSIDGGAIVSGNGSKSISVKWGAIAGTGTVSVREKNSAGCYGDTKTLSVTLTSGTAFTVAPSNISFMASGESKTVVLSNAGSWTATEELSWISMDKVTGTGDGSVIITADKNASSEARTGSISMKSGQTTVIVSVSQNGADMVAAAVDTMFFSADQGNQSAEITSSAAWSAQTSDTWIGVSNKSGAGGLSGSIMVSVAQNTSLSGRIGSVRITAGTATTTLYIVQSGNNNAASNKQYVKFSVDMKGFTVNTTGVHVTGDFQEAAGLEGGNWQSNTAPLKREGTSTIYSGVYQVISNAVYQFKFLNGDQFYDSEIVPEASQVGYEFNDNRWFIADSTIGDTIYIGPLQYSGNAKTSELMTRFKVNMLKYNPDKNAIVKVLFFDSIQSNGKVVKMHSFDGKIFEVLHYAPINTTYNYVFYSQIPSGITEVIGADCGKEGKRNHIVSNDAVLPVVCFNECLDCIATTVSETVNNSQARVYPNPAKDIIIIESPFEKWKIVIKDMLGRTITSVGMNYTPQQRIDISELPSGMYKVEIWSDTMVESILQFVK